MDVNRYYFVPKKSKGGKNESNEEKNTSNSKNKPLFTPKRLATPEAFFQRQQKQKEADKKRMLKIAARRSARHNFTVRFANLKHAREALRQELSMKVTGKKAGETKGTQLTEDQYLQNKRTQNSNTFKNGMRAHGVYMDELAEALEDEDDDAINRSIVEDMFKQFAPERLHEVDDLMEKYKGDEVKLFQNLANEFRVGGSKTKKKTTSSEPVETLTREEKVASFYTQSPSPRGPKLSGVNSRRGSMNSFKLKPARTMEAVDVSEANLGLETLETGDLEAERQQKKSKVKRKKEEQNAGIKSIPSTSQLRRDEKRKTYNSLQYRNSKSNLRRLKTEADEMSVGSGTSRLSRVTMYSFNSVVDPEQKQELVKFQRALDTEIKSKQKSGEYVLSIVEHGGRWWVNREEPTLHSSQRRRNTLLDDLRNGNVPPPRD